MKPQNPKTRIRNVLYDRYLRRLEKKSSQWRVPDHVGIIMDGNRRFGRTHNLGQVENAATEFGQAHDLGADKLEQVLDWCFDYGVRVVTVWAFSVDNFKRDEREVSVLMQLLEKRLNRLIKTERIHREKTRVRGIGRIDLLPPEVQKALELAHHATENYDQRQLNIGVAYGGREEIVDAFRKLLASAEATGKTVHDVRQQLTVEQLTSFMYMADLPDPDLIIRTSGESRLSGFLLWQSAHSELHFCDALWPAFRKIDFLRAMRDYDQRDRRFGR